MRHYLLTGPISSASRRVVKAAAAAALITARRFPPPHLAGVVATIFGAVDLTPVAMTANQRLPSAEGAQEETTTVAVIETAPTLDATACVWT